MSEIFKLATPFDDDGRAIPDQVTTTPAPRRAVRDNLEIINPSQWSGKQVPERRWIVDGMVPSGAVTMLTGDGGLGKSLLTMQLLVAAAAGRPWLGLPVSPCRCLGIFCEDEADELHRRLADIADFYEIGFDGLQNLRLVSRVGKANELWTVDKYGKPKEPSLLYRQVLDEARSFGAQLVVLDSLHDLFPGNENDRTQARRFIGMLRHIALSVDGAVILCAHPSLSGMSSGSGSAGSTAWNNACRSRWYLSRPKEEDQEQTSDSRILRGMKSNYGRTGETIRLRWSQGVFVSENNQLPGDVISKIDRKTAFLKALDAVVAQKRTVSDKPRASNYAPRILETMPQAKGHGKKALESAMFDLLADGTITMGNLGIGLDRHPMIGLRRTGDDA